DKGKELLEKELKKQGVTFNEISKCESYNKFKKRYNLHSMDDLYASIGVGQIIASSYVSRLKEDSLEQTKEKLSKEEEEKSIEEQIAKNERKETSKKKDKNKGDFGVVVKGLNNIMVRFAKCCNPVPGDEVMGYITKGRGVSLHRKDCNNLKALVENESEKIVEATFGKCEKSAYIAEIQVKSDDRVGILTDVMLIINESGLPLQSLNANSTKGNVAIMTIKVKINSVDQLTELMKKIKRLKGVSDVYRMNK
ncbi:MAG: ACT domain-containing protein, partial [Clostridium sp.]